MKSYTTMAFMHRNSYTRRTPAVRHDRRTRTRRQSVQHAGTRETHRLLVGWATTRVGELLTSSDLSDGIWSGQRRQGWLEAERDRWFVALDHIVGPGGGGHVCHAIKLDFHLVGEGSLAKRGSRQPGL